MRRSCSVYKRIVYVHIINIYLLQPDDRPGPRVFRSLYLFKVFIAIRINTEDIIKYIIVMYYINVISSAYDNNTTRATVVKHCTCKKGASFFLLRPRLLGDETYYRLPTPTSRVQCFTTAAAPSARNTFIFTL